MLKIENVLVCGWEPAIRGMRNPKNSWDKSDSGWVSEMNEDGVLEHYFEVGKNDLVLMKNLAEAGSDHRKYMRMIVVYVDVTAPLYWWKEFDTYKVGTVANSCSTMHKIHERELTLDDFSTDNMSSYARDIFEDYLYSLNTYIETYHKFGDKSDWYDIIQSLPMSYNQKRTVMMNYEVLRNIYKSRKNHKLDEWHQLCDWIKSLPYNKLITGGE